MKKTIAVIALLTSSCYPLRNARFVDNSQDTAKAWLCVPDKDEPTNAAGIECADTMKFGLELVPLQEVKKPVAKAREPRREGDIVREL